MNETPTSIAASNFLMALDQTDEYATEAEAIAAYFVNAIDTAREYQVSAEATAAEYLAFVYGGKALLK